MPRTLVAGGGRTREPTVTGCPRWGRARDPARDRARDTSERSSRSRRRAESEPARQVVGRGMVIGRRMTGALAAAVITTVCACSAQSAGTRDTAGASTAGTPADTAGTVLPVPGDTVPGDTGQPTSTSTSAIAVLTTLPIKGRAPMTGYSRAQFGPAWTDNNDDPGGHNGCDTRNDILRRDLTDVALKPGSNGCTVATGDLRDPYTAKSIAFTRSSTTSTAVQIDHVVALGDAWQTGSQQWSLARRVDLGNDRLNLLAVDGPSNESKGDADAASWLPPNKSYRCAYVARQVAVKAKYGLWVTHAEHDAIARVLGSCIGQAVPVEAGGPSRATSHGTS
jgi:Protein of unknown function (DUF1524)